MSENLFDQASALCESEAATGWDYIADDSGYLTLVRLNFADNTYVIAGTESGDGCTWTWWEPSAGGDIPLRTDGGDLAMFSDDMMRIAAGIRRTVCDAEMLADLVEQAIPAADRNTFPVDGGWTLTSGGWALSIWDDPDADAPHGVSWKLTGPDGLVDDSGGWEALTDAEAGEAATWLAGYLKASA